ncbi:hypothetical protein [Candidatus Magnetominusculus xianensis]|uniref:hypothetical protein n=1 Tax=Candidatus Magnetominusculus xianensis TaxID=1748249 RepID=UPI000A0FC2CC|nr:hypothetical protein [Candidatus Magnetominusculus xianensis]
MKTVESCEIIRRNRDNLLSIVNQLRVGAIMLDENGNTIFASNLVLNTLPSGKKTRRIPCPPSKLLK